VRNLLHNNKFVDSSFSLFSFNDNNEKHSVYYSDCLQSFLNRSHRLNDGISLKIGIFSLWSKTSIRALIRESYKKFIPENGTSVNFYNYCSDEELLYREKYGQEQLNSVKFYIPLKSPYHFYNQESFNYNNKCASDQIIDFSYLSIYDNIEIKFIFGQFNNSLDNNSMMRQTIYNNEILLYKDLEFLSINESVNGGKSLEYFQSQAQKNIKKKSLSNYWMKTSQYHFDYVLKLDDDSFIYLPRYIKELRLMKNSQLKEIYYGQLLHFPHTPRPPIIKPSLMPVWAAGAGYTLSDDLFEWLVTKHFDSVKSRLISSLDDEDLLIGEWFKLRGKDFGRDTNFDWNGRINDNNNNGGGGDNNSSELIIGEESYRRHKSLVANYVNMMPLIYNYPGDSLTWAWMRQLQFHDSTIIVHYVKKPAWWDLTVKHFMCNEPVKFHWTNLPNETWWKTKEAQNGDLYYNYKDNGEIIYSNNWFDDWHQAYREDRDEARGMAEENKIVLHLGNLTGINH